MVGVLEGHLKFPPLVRDFNSLEFFAEDLCQAARLVEAGGAWFAQAFMKEVSVRGSAQIAQNVVDSRKFNS